MGSQSSVRDCSQNMDSTRRPCQQMAARLSSFIKFEPSVDRGNSISASKFFLEGHIKWLSLLWVHNCEDSMRCVESTERIVTPHYLFLSSQHLEIHGTSHFIDKLTKTTLMYWVQSFIQFLHQTCGEVPLSSPLLQRGPGLLWGSPSWVSSRAGI